MTISPEPVRTTQPTEEAAAVAATRGGDRDAFAALCERYRRQLHVHCYRMLGSVDDADDLVQDTYLKAWQARASFEGRSLFRTWLYRIATNACLDVLARRPKRVMPPDVRPPEQVLNTDFAPPVELPWLQPYPDRLLEVPAPAHDEPSVVVEERETIELAYLAAIQHLPAAPAGGADPARRHVLVCQGDRRAARPQRGRRQQPAAARAGHDAGEAARAALRVDTGTRDHRRRT